MLVRNLHPELIAAAHQLARRPYQERPDGLYFPARQGFVAAEQRHPAHGVVRQHGALEQQRAGHEVMTLDMGQPHLVLRFVQPGFAGGALPVSCVRLPGRQTFRGDVAEVVVHRRIQQRRLTARILRFGLASHRHEAPLPPP